MSQPSDLTNAALAEAVRDLQRRLDLSEDKVSQLSSELAHLKIHTAALMRILLRQDHIDRHELMRMVDEIDREDGVADGKFTS